jgi:phospholipid/cholesterol/gamma-HCH transport system substrate-binding protein
MAPRSQTIRVGLFAAAALVLLAIVLIVFGGLRFWERSERYRIVFSSSVMGLESGTQVYFNGIRVGTVDKVGVAPDDLRKVEVAIEVKRGTPIRADTQAMLQRAGITGLKVIDLRGGNLESPVLPPGSEIAVGVGLLDRLETQAEQIIEQTAALVQRANVLTDQLIAVTEPVQRAATGLASLTTSLEDMVGENRIALRESLAAVRRAASGTSKLLDEHASRLFVNAGDFVSDLRQVLSANEGSVRAALFDLRQASRSFKELARDVRQRPSRLLFSSAPGDRKLP